MLAWQKKNREKYSQAQRAQYLKNRERRIEYARRRRAEDPERVRASQRKCMYGITAEDFASLLRKQRGVCAICNQSCSTGRQLAVDHDHATGKVRGLLCSRCNRGLGHFKDDVLQLQAALAYLLEHNKES